MRHDRLLLSLVLGATLAGGLILPVRGESLWSDDGWFADPYSDFRASRPGDPIMVIVSEHTTGSGDAQSSGGRSTNINLAAGAGIFDFIPPAGLSSETSRQAQRGESRNFSLRGVITCQVSEVLENGNLRIKGSKEMILNKQREILTIEGVVSPRDITANNSVLSTQVLDAVIKLDGTLRPRERSGLVGLLNGIFGSVLDFLF
ncbi:MAG TPA: flagellar basal body L-ring protein FlgH [Atribacteraceae bacterium]|nr:flagellar basal body L-ring protein FlgH [Atribacteraceae bacterium]